MKTLRSICLAPSALALSMLLASSSLLAADAKELVLAEGMGVQVTGADVLAEAERAPPAQRQELLSKPETAGQIASNLYVRRALAAEAIQAGLDKHPIVQAQLKIARDRVLSDARLAVIDIASMPSAEAVSAYAKNAYQAEPKRFEAPEEVRAQHILVKGTGPESRAKAEKLLADIKAGADFEALAKESSDDPGSAAKGGDLGFFGKGRMVPAFEQAAFGLEKPGALSPIVESPFGFHIIKLVERRPAGVRPFSEVEGALKDEAANKIVTAARQEEVKGLLEKVKFDKAAIEAFAAAQK